MSKRIYLAKLTVAKQKSRGTFQVTSDGLFFRDLKTKPYHFGGLEKYAEKQTEMMKKSTRLAIKRGQI